MVTKASATTSSADDRSLVIGRPAGGLEVGDAQRGAASRWRRHPAALRAPLCLSSLSITRTTHLGSFNRVTRSRRCCNQGLPASDLCGLHRADRVWKQRDRLEEREV